MVNEWGAGVSIDNLGENVTNADEAKHSAELYHNMLDEIDRRKLNANISLKLTHMGLDVSEDLAFSLVTELVDHAVRINNFVRVDMEGSPYTQRTLDFVRGLHRLPGHAGRVGTVIQSYLFRSEKDVNDLLSERIRIRLCKGAYKEPPDIAFPKKADVDRELSEAGAHADEERRLSRPRNPRREHHRRAEAVRARGKHPTSAYEFQMLYGVRRDLQQQLVREGYGLRVYIPFGSEWYPYFMRRLAERPANVLFIARNMFRQ